MQTTDLPTAIDIKMVIDSLNRIASALEGLSAQRQAETTSMMSTAATPEAILLRSFLTDEVQRSSSKDSDISTSELIEVVGAYCEIRGLEMPSVTVVNRALPAAIYEIFGVLKTHSLERDGKPCRGYRGLAFKTSEE